MDPQESLPRAVAKAPASRHQPPHPSHPVRFAGFGGPHATTITYRIDLGRFEDKEPIIGYADDFGLESGVCKDGNKGLLYLGWTRYEADCFVWLEGPRICHLFKVDRSQAPDGIAELRTLSCGEFCLEITLHGPTEIEILAMDEFCCK